MAEQLFSRISRRAVADPATSAEVLVQLKLESRERVDQLVDAAIRAGGQAANPPNDQGFLYERSYTDLTVTCGTRSTSTRPQAPRSDLPTAEKATA